MLLSEGQMSDHTGAKLLYPNLPSADTLIADKGYDSDEFREALAARNIEACIPPKRNRKNQHSYDKQLYKARHKIENMFGRLKDWRRISTRYDRCAHTFFSAICIAASMHLLSQSMSPEPSRARVLLHGPMQPSSGGGGRRGSTSGRGTAACTEDPTRSSRHRSKIAATGGSHTSSGGQTECWSERPSDKLTVLHT